VAAAGAYQLFRGNVVQQTTLLTFIDVFWCLALLAVAGILLVLMLQWRDYVAHRELSRPPGTHRALPRLSVNDAPAKS
jgi:hypothetical protein